MEVLLVQFLVLAFTGALWWLARRDLASRAASSPIQADTQDLEQLCATLEALVTDLARRLESLERQTALQRPAETNAPLPRFSEVGALLAASSVTAAPTAAMPIQTEAPADAPRATVARREERAAALEEWGEAARPPAETAPAADPRQAALDALLEAGITDPAEIVRRTGLGRGEVDLILSLRARRAL